MDVSTFYAVFSATNFTLVGLWWGVTLRDDSWVVDPARRREVAGVYVAFLLPALMGLFAQVGGIDEPRVWRISFVVIAVVGAAATLRLLLADAGRGLTALRAAAVAIYAVVALVGLVPRSADLVGLRPIQVEALLLVLLVGLGHALVWHWLVRAETGRDQ